MVLPTHLQYKCFYNAIRAHSACATRDPMYVYVVSSFPPLSKTNILIINLQIFVEHSINPAEGIILPLTAFLRPHPRQMVGPITSATSAILFPSFFWCIYCHIFVPFSQILRTRLAARKTTKKDRRVFQVIRNDVNWCLVTRNDLPCSNSSWRGSWSRSPSTGTDSSSHSYCFFFSCFFFDLRCVLPLSVTICIL